eukprot:450477_1
MDENAIRAGWKINSRCQIYSNSKKKWFLGEIVRITTDEQGEWLEVRYNQYMSKQVQRYGSEIKPQQLQTSSPPQLHTANVAENFSFQMPDSLFGISTISPNRNEYTMPDLERTEEKKQQEQILQQQHVMQQRQFQQQLMAQQRVQQTGALTNVTQPFSQTSHSSHPSAAPQQLSPNYNSFATEQPFHGNAQPNTRTTADADTPQSMSQSQHTS